MLLPAGTPPANADEFYDCAADVLALPGGYKQGYSEEEEGQGDMARAFLTMATGRKDAGLHLRFNSKTQNGLRQVKKAADLADFIPNPARGIHLSFAHPEGLVEPVRGGNVALSGDRRRLFLTLWRYRRAERAPSGDSHPYLGVLRTSPTTRLPR